MTHTKLSPEDAAKITELLPWLEKIDIPAAVRLAALIPLGEIEELDAGEWIPLRRGGNIWDTMRYAHVRVTLKMPPLRRALRREELPEEFEWTLNGNTFDFLPSRDWDVMTHQDAKWSSDFGETWHSFFIDEPQPDLVVGGEGS